MKPTFKQLKDFLDVGYQEVTRSDNNLNKERK